MMQVAMVAGKRNEAPNATNASESSGQTTQPIAVNNKTQRPTANTPYATSEAVKSRKAKATTPKTDMTMKGAPNTHVSICRNLPSIPSP